MQIIYLYIKQKTITIYDLLFVMPSKNYLQIF